uniref:Uncharacterized protein n=1 Tax=Arundo donax TaxID=35708 RepID=A0A0A8ZLI5_ARUDO
MDYNRPSP